jgi:hypothetical protein
MLKRLQALRSIILSWELCLLTIKPTQGKLRTIKCAVPVYVKLTAYRNFWFSEIRFLKSPTRYTLMPHMTNEHIWSELNMNNITETNIYIYEWYVCLWVHFVAVIFAIINIIIIVIIMCFHYLGRWLLMWFGLANGLLTTYIHHSELQVLTVLSLISTLYKSQQHPLSLFQPAVFTSRSLATASFNGDSSASRDHVVAVQRITELLSAVNSTIALSFLSLPCRAQLNCQPSTELPTHQPTTSLHFTQLNCTQPAWGPYYIASGWTQQKTLFFYCCGHVHFRGNVFTEPLLRNACSLSWSFYSNGTTRYSIIVMLLTKRKITTVIAI